MADSTLDLSRTSPSVTTKGHGTRALGPSDTSDSGSDLQGPGLYEHDPDVNLASNTGTSADAAHAGGAGRDVGDANLDSDTDASGTGERASAGRDTDVEAGTDIAPDRLLKSGAAVTSDALDQTADDAGDEEF